MAKKEEVKVERGSGNVYADLGFHDAKGQHARAQLVRVIASIVQNEGWTQKEAAEMAGLGQPDICRLLRGQFGGYSLARLYLILNRLGRDVTITVKKSNKSKKGTTLVHAGR